MRASFLTIIMTCLLSFYSCEKDSTVYAEEYVYLKPAVENRLKDVNREVADSVYLLLDNYTKAMTPLSCTYCVVDLKEFAVLKAYCMRHRESAIYVLDHALQPSRSNWGFREIFKSIFSEEYSEILRAYSIVLIPEAEIENASDRWNNRDREYSVPFKVIAERFLELSGKQK